MTSRRVALGGALLAAAMAAASAAGAVTATIEVSRFGRADLAAAQAAQAAFLTGHAVGDRRVETFEGFAPWGTGGGTQDPKNTAVGDFSAHGQAGSGHSMIGAGNHLQVRNDDPMRWGRYDTDAALAGLGGNWLDSNDNTGIRWDIAGLGRIDVLSFFLIDVADVGGRFSIKVGDTLLSDIAKGRRLPNGNIHLVHVLLDEAVDRLTVHLMHDRTNDGFGIDGVTAGRIAPVPLPPAAALLVPAVVLLGAMRRRARRSRTAPA